MRFTPSNLLSLLAVGAILQPVVVPRAITTGLINGRDESGLTKCDVTLGCVDKTIQVPDLEDHAVIPALQKRKGRRPGSNNKPNRNGHGKPSKPATSPTTSPKPSPTTKPSSVSTTQPAKTSPTTSKEEPTTSSKVHSSTSSKVVSNTRTTSSVTSSRLTSPSTSRVASTTKPVTSSTTTLGSQTSAHPISSANSSTKSGENSALNSEEQSATPSKTPFITNSTSTTKPTSEAELTTTSEEAHTTAKSGNTVAPTSSEKGSATWSESATTDLSYTPVPTQSDVSSSSDEYSATESVSTPKHNHVPVRRQTQPQLRPKSQQTTEPSLSHGRNNNKNTSILSWEEYMEDDAKVIKRLEDSIQIKKTDVRAIDIERRYEVKHGEAVIGGVVENKPNVKWDFWKLTRLGENARYARTIVKLQNLEKQGKAKEEVSQDVNGQNKDVISDNYYNKAQKTMVIAWSNVNIDNTEPEDTRLRWSDITFEGWKEHAGDDVKNLRWIVRNNIISEGTSATVREAIRRVGRNPDRRVDFAPDPNDSAMNEAFTVLAGTPNVKGVFHLLADHHEMGGLKVKKIHAFGANMLLITVGR
ncbi:hypothetical protein A7C99_2861 [Trichophyton rubrum]|uniref:Uncharacterized protein n=3 Tax=Trichophyton TaxID=5550 RepID=A0A178F038_TRIRU|nr:hypothetical protein A7C99_2861 [Trichophyton rubrum]